MANDGGPAFPASVETSDSRPGDRAWVDHPGMSLRDWFAGQVLSGHLGSRDSIVAAAHGAGKFGLPVAEYTARLAYEYADAMLAERQRETSHD